MKTTRLALRADSTAFSEIPKSESFEIMNSSKQVPRMFFSTATCTRRLPIWSLVMLLHSASGSRSYAQTYIDSDTVITSSWNIGNVYINNSATLTAAGNTASIGSGSLFIGTSSGGHMVINNGGTVSSASGYLGSEMAPASSVKVTGTNSKWTSSDAIFLTNGRIEIANGGTVSTATSYLGSEMAPASSVKVAGTNSKWTSSGWIYLTNGSLEISSGGQINGGALSISGNSSITVDGASSQLSVGSASFSLGSFGGGSPSITIKNGGALSAGNSINLEGTLNIGAASGDAAGSAGIINTGLLNRDESYGFGPPSATIQFNTIGTHYFTNNGAASGAGVAISGSNAVVVTAGTNVFTGNLTHTEGTTINGGTMRIGNGGTTGSIAGNIINKSALVFSRSDNYTYAGNISGSGTLTQAGSGTLTLTGNHIFTGVTTVDTGTLSVNGSIKNSAITLNGGTLRYNSAEEYTGDFTFTSGSLGGTNLRGSLGGLTIGSNQTLSPGNSPGTAETTGLIWGIDGSYLWELNNATGTAGAGSGWDLVNGSGILNVTSESGSEFNILITSLTSLNAAGLAENFNDAVSYNWLIADFDSVTNFAVDAITIDTSAFLNSFTGTFGVALGGDALPGDNSQIYLTYTAIPEPSSAVALLVGLSGLLPLYRRRPREGNL